MLRAGRARRRHLALCLCASLSPALRSIYPGHGTRFVSRTGLLVILSCSKASALFHARKKPGACAA